MRVAITTVAAVLCLLNPTIASATSSRSDNFVHPLTVHQLLTRQQAAGNVLGFFQNHRWLVAPRHATCWTVPWAHTCNRARLVRRAARVELASINRRIVAIQRAHQARLAHDWLYHGLLCIHGGEGAWNSNTGNGYYGGLQMDRAFQAHWGPDFMARWGTADNWPPWAQMIAGERAYHGLGGFGSWPNTARVCGLR